MRSLYFDELPLSVIVALDEGITDGLLEGFCWLALETGVNDRIKDIGHTVGRHGFDVSCPDVLSALY